MNRDGPLPDYTLARLVSSTVNYALARGLDLELIAAETNLQTQNLINPDGRLPDEVLPRIWRLLEGNGQIMPPALHMASATVPSTLLGSWGGLICYARSLREALQAQVQFSSIIANRLSFELVESQSFARLEFSHPLDLIDGGHATELGAAVLYRAINESFDGDLLVGVDFAHAPHGSIQSYSSFFRVPVRFQQEKCALIFRQSTLDSPMKNANPTLFDYVQNNLILQWSRWDVSNPHSFLMQVKRAIQRNAAQGNFDAKALASEFGISLRSLQRQLQFHGMTAGQLLSDECKARAKYLLTHTTRSVSDIGRSLGYSDDRAFRRAFNRWTGLSPTAFRKQQVFD